MTNYYNVNIEIASSFIIVKFKLDLFSSFVFERVFFRCCTLCNCNKEIEQHTKLNQTTL
jgi:hypothetical protein